MRREGAMQDAASSTQRGAPQDVWETHDGGMRVRHRNSSSNTDRTLRSPGCVAPLEHAGEQLPSALRARAAEHFKWLTNSLTHSPVSLLWCISADSSTFMSLLTIIASFSTIVPFVHATC
eukprot:1992494-Pyramimonas_sp.AAC.1